MRVVLDTNVLLSGLMYPHSTPGKIVQAWQENRFEQVLSVEQLTEIGRVLNYPKICKILKWSRREIEAYLKQLYYAPLPLISPAPPPPFRKIVPTTSSSPR